MLKSEDTFVKNCGRNTRCISLAWDSCLCWETAVSWRVLRWVEGSIEADRKLDPLQEETNWPLDATKLSAKC